MSVAHSQNTISMGLMIAIHIRIVVYSTSSVSAAQLTYLCIAHAFDTTKLAEIAPHLCHFNVCQRLPLTPAVEIPILSVIVTRVRNILVRTSTFADWGL
jgi:uncharacterized membrane protein